MVSLGGEAAFPPGSTVQFSTSLKATVVGEVACFDPSLKVLVLKQVVPGGGKPVMRMFNMTKITDIKELSPPSEKFEAPASNSQQYDRYSIAEQRRRGEMMEEEISVEGQQAFVQLRRTLDDVSWQGSDISVLGRVVVKAPYNADSAVASQDDDQCHSALQHVKKILSKPFVAERRLTPHTEQH